MRFVRCLVPAASFAAVFTLQSQASATTDPPAPHDARSVGMGSTGVASTHNAAAMFHNVAALHEVRRFAGTLSFSPTKIDQTSPFPVLGEVESDSRWIPLFLVGAAYRVHERVVVGLAAYATGGLGAEYDTPAGDMKLTLGALEFSPGVAVGITDKLSLGLGYRVTYMMQNLEMPAIPNVAPASKLDLDGTNFLGVHVGIYYRPIESLKLGLAYRSKVNAELEGEMEAAGQKLDASSEFAFPHGFRIGAAFEAIPETLTLAFDVRYLLHSEANEKSVIEVPPGPPLEQDLDWEDSINVGIGAEYNVTPMVPVRAGYGLTTSATPEDKAGPFFVPPGTLHSVHLGAGLNFEKLDFDVGAYHSWGAKDVDASTTPGAPTPGRYSLKNYVIAASLTYHTD